MGSVSRGRAGTKAELPALAMSKEDNSINIMLTMKCVLVYSQACRLDPFIVIPSIVIRDQK